MYHKLYDKLFMIGLYLTEFQKNLVKSLQNLEFSNLNNNSAVT